MDNSATIAAVRAVVNACQLGLEDELQAIYLFGSLAQGRHRPGQSDVNLLVVVASETNNQQVHELFQPVWAEHGAVLQRAPLFGNRHAVERHLALNPWLAHHLARFGRLLAGKAALPERSRLTVDAREVVAQLAAEAMAVSALLAPQRLDEPAAAALWRRLRRLAHRMGLQVPAEAPAASLLATVHVRLSGLMERLPPDGYNPSFVQPDDYPKPFGLLAAYEESNQAILVFNELSSEPIGTLAWHKVAAGIVDLHRPLQVADPRQLRLVAQFITPLESFLGRYHHVWGLNVLADLNLPRPRLLRHAARIASHILMSELPHAYLTADDASVEAVIHECQNRLLNVQLQNELLARFKITERTRPPTPMPGHEATAAGRIAAILALFEWWVAYYWEEMKDEG